MDQWIIRKVHESGVIGGNTKLLYEIGPTKEIDGNKPYKNMGASASLEHNSMPVAVPDFTRGDWDKVDGFRHAMAQ